MHHPSLRRGGGAAAAAGSSVAPRSLNSITRARTPAAAANAGRDTGATTRRSRRRDGDQDDDYDPGGEARRRSAEAADAERRRRRDGATTAPTTASATGPPLLLPPSTRLKLVVAYDGTSFAGFQFQKPGVRTVQGELEKGIARVFPLRGRLVGAGRTDGGAHARAMPCHIDVDIEAVVGEAGAGGGEAELRALELAALHLNGFLPPDVKVLSLGRAPVGVPRAKGGGGESAGAGGGAEEGAAGEGDEDEDEDEVKEVNHHLFDAQACALGKEYHYLLSVAASPNPFDEGARRWWAYDRHAEATRGRPPSASAFQSLNFRAMRAALAAIVGAPCDFTALSDNKRPSGLGAAKRKRPKLARLAEQGLLGPRPERTAERNTRKLWRASAEDEGGGRARLVLAGDGFLYHQVRVTAAALLEIGQGRLSVAAFEKGLRDRDRSFGGDQRGGRAPFEAAPACGLFLARVFYPGDEGVGGSPLS